MSTPLNPQDCIFHLLAKASKAGNRSWKNATADLGVTAVQGKVLNFLYSEGEVTPGELGELVAIDSATLTGILDRLESSQLLERHIRSDDRRAVNIRLTATGTELGRTLNQRMQPSNEAFLDKLSAAETAMLRDLLKRF